MLLLLLNNDEHVDPCDASGKSAREQERGRNSSSRTSSVRIAREEHKSRAFGVEWTGLPLVYRFGEAVCGMAFWGSQQLLPI